MTKNCSFFTPLTLLWMCYLSYRLSLVCSPYRYRKVVSNNCTKGVKEMYTARKQQCPNRPPKGLALTTKDDKLTAHLGTNVSFLVHLDEVGLTHAHAYSHTYTHTCIHTHAHIHTHTHTHTHAHTRLVVVWKTVLLLSWLGLPSLEKEMSMSMGLTW